MPDILTSTPYAFNQLYTQNELRAQPPDGIKVLRNGCIDAVTKAAVDTKVASRADDLTIRPVMANLDLSLTNESWVSPALVANTYTQFISQALTTPYVVGFYGMYSWDTNPLISVIRYRMGASGTGSTKAILQMQQLYAQTEPVGYHVPLVYVPGNTIYIDAYAISISGVTTQKFGFIGYTGEPKGKNMVGGAV